MSDLVSIASSAVSAYQRALGTVSNNIANVSSEGYSRQEVNLTENTPRNYGTMYFGTGVNLTGVRRMYDEFVENSLRNATSELGTQGPIVNYANRVVNIMGSEDVGLLSAMDQFFDAARQLSTDSSSIILRGQFLAKAEGLAARFGELHSQLTLVEQETRGLIETDVSKINQLSEQLALVNNQLRKTRYLDRQPPALLDERDLLLRKLAEVAKIQVKEALNGEVTVSLGATITRGQIVTVDGARKVGAVFSDSAVEKVDLMIEPFGKNAEVVSGLSGGSLSGAMSFRRQILAPTFESLDTLAKTLVTQVNAVHQEGIDLQGKDGQALFRFLPQFGLQALNGETKVRLGPEVIDFQAFKANALSMNYRADAGQVNDLSFTGEFKTGDQITVTLNGNARSFTLLGSKLDPSGRPVLGEALTSEEVRRQFVSFLEGGNAFSVDGAFGRQVKVQKGAAEDLLVTSDVFGAFSLDIATTSASGRIANAVNQGRWTVTDTITGQSVSGIRSVEINGMRINFSGEPQNNEMLVLKPQNRAAAGIRLAFDDPLKVAAANRFRVIENQFNPSGVDASLKETFMRFPQDEQIWLPNVVSASGQETLDNNIVPSEAIRLTQVSVSPIAVIPEGYKDVTLYLGDMGNQVLDLQVMTRDGRHILGRQMADDLIAAEEANLGRPLRDDERQALIQQAGTNFIASASLAGASFMPGAGYSSQYLNVEGAESYRDMELFYGVKAMVQEIKKLNEDHVVGGIERLAAQVTSGLVQPFAIKLDATTGKTVIFGSDDFVLNGVALGSLVIERAGTGVALVMQGQDSLGRPMRRVLDLTDAPLREVSPGSGEYEIRAEHLQSWLRAQPGWGQGERQVLAFSRSEAGGSISVQLSPIDTVTVTDIDPYATPSEVASKVAAALTESAYIKNMSGRYVQAMDDGSVVVQFATTDIDMPLIAVDTLASGLNVRITREPPNTGLLGQGEVQTYQFSSATETGVFDIGGARVQVQAGDSSEEVTRKVAAALSGVQKRFTFQGAPTSGIATLNVAIGTDVFSIRLPTGSSPITTAEAIRHGLQTNDDFRALYPEVILAVEPEGAIRFTFPPEVLEPAPIDIQPISGLSVVMDTPSRFIDAFEGRRVTINADGSLTVRYLATEGNRPNLGITPVKTPWPEVQTLSFSLQTGQARASGSFSVQDKPVLIDDTDSVAAVVDKTLQALQAQYQTVIFNGSAQEGETLDIRIGDLVIPLTLAPLTPSRTYEASDIAQAVYSALYPNPGGPNPRDGLFAERYPFSSIQYETPSTLRFVFDPSAGNVSQIALQPKTATLISAEVSVQPRFGDRFPGVSLEVSGDGTSIVARYPVELMDVPNLQIPNAASLGLAYSLNTENYRETTPGVYLNATTRDFIGLELELLSVFDPAGNPVLGGLTGPAQQVPLSQLRFTQTPLGQGELQTLFFGTPSSAGEIEIGGVRIKLDAGMSGADVAMRVRDALQKALGSSVLSSTERQFFLNGDGSLSVRAAVGAQNVRDLQMTDVGATGVSFRSETVDFIADAEPFRSEVRLGFGKTGNANDLAKLGFRTGAYLTGLIKEDLLIFTTGRDSGLGYSLGATYTEGSRDPVDSLRAEPFDVVFTSPTQYRIIDRATGTIVADRVYDPFQGISYRGLTMTLNADPMAGDRFSIDGNQDGIGNNANTLRIIELQNAKVFGGPNGRSMADAYGQTVSDVGSMAFQAGIAQKALEVVKDQAVQARDKVSGVSLDEEAADLIRFQQAYQASAKVMQTASLLFDAIIQIR